MQALEVGQDLVLALQIQRRQRLVQQQQARAGEQGTHHAHALALAAGQATGHALEQMTDAQQLHRLLPRHLVRPGAAHAVFQVASHRQVRKQAGLLEDVAQRALVGGHEDARGAVLPELTVDLDSRPSEAASRPTMQRRKVVLPEPE